MLRRRRLLSGCLGGSALLASACGSPPGKPPGALGAARTPSELTPMPNDSPRPGAPQAGRQVAQSRQLTIQIQARMDHWLYLPSGYAAAPQARWPLLVFLHGSGERGQDLQRVKANGPPGFIESRPDLPFVLVSPQLPADGGWDPHLLHALLLQLQAELRIDPDRVSATGLSMGGIGVWAWAIEYPDDLAAIAPICGFGDEDRVERIRRLPVWAFHGEDDDAVPIGMHQRTLDALRAVGGQPRFTRYVGVGHEAWTPAYAEPELFPWLLAQRRRAAPAS